MTLDLSVAMLVREPPMDRLAALVSYMSEVASEFVIVDTGSSMPDLQAFARWNKAPFGIPKVQIIRATFKDDFAEARNIGLLQASRAWTLVLDPDELPSIGMVGHIRRVVEDPNYRPEASGWLYHTQNYWDGILEPDQEMFWHVRLFRTGQGRFYRALDELVELDGLPEPETRNTSRLPKAPKSAYLIHSKSGSAITESKALYERLGKRP